MALTGTSEVLVWFPKKQIVVAGTESLVTDMAKALEQGAASLEKNQAFEKARADFRTTRASSASSVELGARERQRRSVLKEIIGGYFKSAGRSPPRCA